jgi:mRNA-degrading endonuclease RelE of RelBE toxin-antitoxin system
MNFEIVRTDAFSKHLKSLSKKYSSIKNDYSLLLHQLNIDPALGIPLGQNCYKIRMKIASKNSGKSGGARVITYVKIDNKKITLLEIYDKGEKDTITDKELSALLKKVDQ